MNRKKRIVLESLILVVLAFIFLRFNSFYLSGEALLHANERGLHYGPSTEVLAKVQEGKNLLMIGWVDNRSISIIQGEKFGPLYRLSGGGISGLVDIPTEDYGAWAGVTATYECMYGIVDKELYPDCTRVVCSFEKRNNGPDVLEFEVEADVLENGFFINYETGVTKKDYGEWVNSLNILGYDDEGNLVFKNY